MYKVVLLYSVSNPQQTNCASEGKETNYGHFGLTTQKESGQIKKNRQIIAIGNFVANKWFLKETGLSSAVLLVYF